MAQIKKTRAEMIAESLSSKMKEIAEKYPNHATPYTVKLHESETAEQKLRRIALSAKLKEFWDE